MRKNMLKNRHDQRNHKVASPCGIFPNPYTLRWIVDFGSSDHMSPAFKIFLKYFLIVPKSVRFGNGPRVTHKVEVMLPLVLPTDWSSFLAYCMLQR